MAKRYDRLTPHTPDGFETLSIAFRTLSELAAEVAKIMREHQAEVVRVEHWQGTKSGMYSAQEFLLDAKRKASGATATLIEGFLEQVENASKRKQKPEINRLGKSVEAIVNERRKKTS